MLWAREDGMTVHFPDGSPVTAGVATADNSVLAGRVLVAVVPGFCRLVADVAESRRGFWFSFSLSHSGASLIGSLRAGFMWSGLSVGLVGQGGLAGGLVGSCPCGAVALSRVR